MPVPILPVLVLTSLSLLLASCTSTARLESQRAQTDLIGLKKSELMTCAGVPERTVQLEDGKEFLSYSSEQTVEVPANYSAPGFYPGFGYSRHRGHFHNSFLFYGGTRSETRQCTTTIGLEDDRVTSVTYQQNDPDGFAIRQCYQIIRNCLPEKPKK